MQIVIMEERCDLSLTLVMNALKIVRQKGGVREVRFIELSYGPDAESINAAMEIATKLMIGGFGVALRVDWGFAGTSRWAVQSENVRVANEGGELRPLPSVMET